MLLTYLKQSWRSLRKNRTYSVLNIIGLSASLVCFAFISGWVTDELSYDRFNKNYDRIFRLAGMQKTDAGTVGTAVSSAPMAAAGNGLPSENLLSQNILVAVGKQAGAVAIDLSPYKLIMKDEVLVALEWIEGSSTAEHGAIFLSAGLLNSSTWHRLTSQAVWKKFSGMGVGFNVDVQLLR